MRQDRGGALDSLSVCAPGGWQAARRAGKEGALLGASRARLLELICLMSLLMSSWKPRRHQRPELIQLWMTQQEGLPRSGCPAARALGTPHPASRGEPVPEALVALPLSLEAGCCFPPTLHLYCDVTVDA